MPKLSRRQLAKSLTAGAVAPFLAGALPEAGAAQTAASATTSQPEALTWHIVAPGIWKASLGQSEAITPVKSRLLPSAQIPATPTGEAEPPTTIKGATTARGCLLTLPLAPQEFVYGFGLQLLSMESRGKKRMTRVNADPRLDTGDSHAPVPFFVTSRGYGILVDTARVAEFNVGNVRLPPTEAIAASSSAVNTPQTSRRLADADPGLITIQVPRAQGVEVYLFAGPSMLDAVRRYNLFSGGGALPPEWGLGFWYRGDGRATQAQIIALAKEFRQRNIPCDVLGLEPGWQTHAYSCTFVWDETRFPEPRRLLQELDGLHLKTNLWEHAYTYPSSPLFKPLQPHSGNYGVWGGLAPDFAGEPARRIFGDYHGKYLIDAGVAGFKLDECDGSDYTGGWSFPDFSVFPSGVDGEQMHALFGIRYQHTINEQFRARERPTYSLVRSSGALAAPYPFVLYSDLYDHREFVRGISTAGFSGLLWCPEVRDAVSSEDLIRRLQSVVFSPLAMINGWYIKNPPWKQIDRKRNDADDFTPGWEELESRCREIIGWRMQLVPYLLAAFRRYAADGTPPFRSVVLDFPEPALARVDDQYMMGDRLMVAPLFHGEAERSILMPPGTWYDFWTGETIAGGAMRQVTASERNIPVFVRGGCVLPFAAITASTADPGSKRLEARAYGDGEAAWNSMGGQQLQWNAQSRKANLSGSGPYTLASSRHMG